VFRVELLAAHHLYVVLETVEAGIVLVGNEVKSPRLRRACLGEACATVNDHEMWPHNVHIAAYAFGTCKNDAFRCERKLLLRRAGDRAMGADRPGERFGSGGNS
jgi:SsrA-binding protein